MSTFGGRLGVLAAAAILSKVAFAAEGSAEALMVAVEVDPSVGLDAQDVRQVIAAELHRTIVAPAAAPAVDAADVLLVAVSRARIVVSFRARSDERASRAIPTPRDRAARLRAVAWLSGNLARDQVSPLIVTAVDDRLEERTTAASAAPPEPRPSQTVPPPVIANPSLSGPNEGEVVRVSEASSEPSPAEPTWRIGFTSGAAIAEGRAFGDGSLLGVGLTWQGEVQHRMTGGWLLGGAIDFGPTLLQRVGYAVTGGFEQREHGFRLEETLGLGVGTDARTTTTTVSNSSVTGPSSATTVSSGPGLYARAFLTASHPVWRSWDVVLRVGAYSDLEGTLQSASLATSLGVRLSSP